MKKILLFLLYSVLLSCKTEPQKQQNSKKSNAALFTVLTATDTGISFINELKENTYMNGLFYEYYYNGGGVAVADFNNDSLIDIYFVNSLGANSLYLNKGNMKFEDVTKKANAGGGYGFGTGVTIVDINNDGLMDIYYSKSGKIQDPNKRRNVLLINKGLNKENSPVFEDQADKYGIDFSGFTTQAAFFDYDKDGDLDMFLINHGIELYDENEIEELIHKRSDSRGERLYQNNNGKFVNVSDQAGIINTMLGFGLGLSIGDLNNDTWPDVYVGNDFSEKDHLYINNKNGTFREVSLDVLGHTSNFSMGNDIADINNDGFFDIMAVDMMAEDNYTQKTSMSGMNPEKFYKHTDIGLHHQYMYNTLQLNKGIDRTTGNPNFSEVAQITGVSSTDWSWAPLFFDMDNDGNKDLFVSNGVKRDFRNNDFINYRKKKQAEVIENKSIDTKTYIADMLAKMPTREKENYFYLNDGTLAYKKTLVDQPAANSNGAAYADFDNDGDLDIVVNNSSSTSFIYKNNAVGNNYLKIKIKGQKSNINGIGAKIELYTPLAKQTIENYYTRGFQSAMANVIHFGLGKEAQVDSLKIIWPNNTYETFTNIVANKTLQITYQKSKVKNYVPNKLVASWFSDITKETTVDYKHVENKYNDFLKESLIPHRMSQLGPALAVADVNGDGLEDFFIGGAKGYEGLIYMQTNAGKFVISKEVFIEDSAFEDVGAVFFDADNDGDVDLYVVSGGTEEHPNNNYYTDRFYENKGDGNFVRNKMAIPSITISGLRVSPSDFDNDGDLDLFIGGRVSPGNYGRLSKSFLLENRSEDGIIKFVDVTEERIPEMLAHTMVTAIAWCDMDNDGFKDLLIANEWGPIELYINKAGIFENKTEAYGLLDEIGWWSSLETLDIDNDGDLDIVAGNLGLNYKYKASAEAPFNMYLNDFDNNKTNDIVLGYQQDNVVYPVRGRQCSSEQMAFIKDKYGSYNAFGNASVDDIYGEQLASAKTYKATNFASSILVNEEGSFSFKAMPREVQLSSINKILLEDYNGDQIQDMLLLGNLYGSEVETPRNDASYGQLLIGADSGTFSLIPNSMTNLWANGDVKDASLIRVGNTKAIIIARNSGELSLYRLNL